MKVTIFHNIARECRTCGRPVMEIGDDQWAHTTPGAGHLPRVGLANFDGYKPGHPLVRVFEAEVEMPHGIDPQRVADWMFEAFNAPEEYLQGKLRDLAEAYRARQLRSLSVGDVVAVGEIPLACVSRGWEPVTGAVNEVLAGDHGSVPLLRTEPAR